MKTSTLFGTRFLSISTLVLAACALTACAGDDDKNGDGDGDGGNGSCDGTFDTLSCSDVDGDCVEVCTAEELQDAANSAGAGTTIILSAGTFTLDNQVTTRGADITLAGQGMDDSILDFGPQTAQANGVDHVGDNFTIQDLEILDAKKDGLRIESSNGVHIQRIRVTWTNEQDETNGSYGIYPVKVQNVLIEDSEANNSSDAGIYVGQCQNAIVRNNTADGNVAGIEIENTQYADVYGNTAVDNSGGVLIFDLPGNPVVGHDIKVHDNEILHNNTPNFAPGGTVSEIPPGSGLLAFASRRVEIYGNNFEDNGTTDIAMISGLMLESDPTVWGLDISTLVGEADLDLLRVPNMNGTAFNYTTNDFYVHDNTHSGGGMDMSNTDPAKQDFSAMLQILYQWGTGGFAGVDTVMYDAIGESTFDPMDAMMNSNDNHICLQGSGDLRFGSLNLDPEKVFMGFIPTLDEIYRPASPFAPFDCDSVASGPIGDISVD